MTTLIQPPPPGYRKWWWVPVALLVLVLAVSAVIVIPKFLDDGCGEGILRNDAGECVGLTDGSFAFSPELEDITSKIAEHNQAMENADGETVSIALLTPMTLGDDAGDGDVTMAGIRHRLAGAHLAQLNANLGANAQGVPKIKLLLANPGSDFSSWEDVVEQIQDRAKSTSDDDGDIVAVTGISFSFESAVKAVDRLTSGDEPLPVIASTLTVDDLAPRRGFVKVSPSASEHARAAAEFLSGTPNKVVLVHDTNPDDRYGRYLADAFKKQFADKPDSAQPETLPFDGGVGTTFTAFDSTADHVCDVSENSEPLAVYFAGRGSDAVAFLNELTGRSCRKVPITVITADDMPYYELKERLAGRALDANVTVYYTGLVHRKAWKDHPEQYAGYAVEPFSYDCEEKKHEDGQLHCYNSFFRDGEVNDFAAVMEHDAVKTVHMAIRQANKSNRVAPIEISASIVSDTVKQLHSDLGFDGASGRIGFDQNGLPINKPILILKATKSGPEFFALYQGE